MTPQTSQDRAMPDAYQDGNMDGQDIFANEDMVIRLVGA